MYKPLKIKAATGGSHTHAAYSPGMDNHEVTAGYQEGAVRFGINAKSRRGPKDYCGVDCWVYFDIKKPPRIKTTANKTNRGKNTAKVTA